MKLHNLYDADLSKIFNPNNALRRYSFYMWKSLCDVYAYQLLFRNALIKKTKVFECSWLYLMKQWATSVCEASKIVCPSGKLNKACYLSAMNKVLSMSKQNEYMQKENFEEKYSKYFKTWDEHKEYITLLRNYASHSDSELKDSSKVLTDMLENLKDGQISLYKLFDVHPFISDFNSPVFLEFVAQSCKKCYGNLRQEKHELYSPLAEATTALVDLLELYTNFFFQSFTNFVGESDKTITSTNDLSISDLVYSESRLKQNYCIRYDFDSKQLVITLDYNWKKNNAPDEDDRNAIKLKFWENFCDICKSYDKDPISVCKEMMLQANTVKKAYAPYKTGDFHILQKASKYLNILPDALLNLNLSKQDYDNAKKRLNDYCCDVTTDIKTLELHFGTSIEAIQNWVSGESSCFDERIAEIADFFDMPINDLIGRVSLKETAHSVDGEILKHTFILPVYESASAGPGAPADNAKVDERPCYIENKSESKDYFFIKVKGDSMQPKIQDGDYILVRKQEGFENGSLVVLTDKDNVDYNYKGFVKKVIKNEKENEVRIISLNDEYEEVVLKGKQIENLKIVGIVKEIIHQPQK